MCCFLSDGARQMLSCRAQELADGRQFVRGFCPSSRAPLAAVLASRARETRLLEARAANV